MHKLSLPGEQFVSSIVTPKNLMQSNLDLVVARATEAQFYGIMLNLGNHLPEFTTEQEKLSQETNWIPEELPSQETQIPSAQQGAVKALCAGHLTLRAKDNDGTLADIVDNSNPIMRLSTITNKKILRGRHPNYQPVIDIDLAGRVLVAAATIATVLGYENLHIDKDFLDIESIEPTELGLSRNSFLGVGYGPYRTEL